MFVNPCETQLQHEQVQMPLRSGRQGNFEKRPHLHPRSSAAVHERPLSTAHSKTGFGGAKRRAVAA
eukprot:578041-Prorocentrum_lima.AAC.1